MKQIKKDYLFHYQATSQHEEHALSGGLITIQEQVYENAYYRFVHHQEVKCDGTCQTRGYYATPLNPSYLTLTIRETLPPLFAFDFLKEGEAVQCELPYGVRIELNGSLTKNLSQCQHLLEQLPIAVESAKAIEREFFLPLVVHPD